MIHWHHNTTNLSWNEWIAWNISSSNAMFSHLYPQLYSLSYSKPLLAVHLLLNQHLQKDLAQSMDMSKFQNRKTLSIFWSKFIVRLTLSGPGEAKRFPRRGSNPQPFDTISSVEVKRAAIAPHGNLLLFCIILHNYKSSFDSSNKWEWEDALELAFGYLSV